jgi:hypothetical protein
MTNRKPSQLITYRAHKRDQAATATPSAMASPLMALPCCRSGMEFEEVDSE